MVCAYVQLQGFDEYMNLVLDEAEEVHMKTKNRKNLGELKACLFCCMQMPM